MSQFFGAENEKGMKQSLIFKFIMGFAGIPATICAVLASALREIGDVKPPLVISVSATLINTFLNWVLIYGKLGFQPMEVRGAAIATLIAMTIQVLAFLVYIMVKKPPFMICRCVDFVRIIVAGILLKRERWLRNLATEL